MTDHPTWRRHGLIWRATTPRPADEPDPPEATTTCTECSTPIRKDATRCRPCDKDWPVNALMERLEANLERIQPKRTPRPLCDCGCLLADPGETCPACLAWAEKEVIKASWSRAVEHYKTREIERSAA